VGKGMNNKCSVLNCEGVYEAKGLCKRHYDLRRRRGDEYADPIVGRGSFKNGYKLLFKPGYPGAYPSDGRMMEHRYIMEQFLQRPLTRDETVHHKNGVRDDNRIENLELWSSSHPYGQRIEDLVEWAQGILALYGDL
jgi:hypothetical protein